MRRMAALDRAKRRPGDGKCHRFRGLAEIEGWWGGQKGESMDDGSQALTLTLSPRERGYVWDGDGNATDFADLHRLGVERRRSRLVAETTGVNPSP